MYNMSNLPRDMVEEILSRIPLTSLRAVRSTCKKWNNLFKDKYFTKKHLLAQEEASRERGEFIAIALIDYNLFLLSFDHRGIYNNDSNDISPFINRKAKLISLDDAYKVDILEVCYCDGLLLCTTSDYSRLIVWNPYTGQTRWVSVEPITVEHQREWYYLGYDKSKSRRAHKILRFVYSDPRFEEKPVHEIFDLNSNSWRILDVTPDCWMHFTYPHSLSLKGNTYWYGGLLQEDTPDNFLVCFDFTTELFGPHLPLPFIAEYPDVVLLSSLREEKIVVLFQSDDDEYEMEIWVSTNIEEVAVSWSKFFAIDMKPLTGYPFFRYGSFIIDEERRAVIVFDTYRRWPPVRPNTAYIIGENGYFKKMDLGKLRWESHYNFRPLLCSYVSSSVQMNQPA